MAAAAIGEAGINTSLLILDPVALLKPKRDPELVKEVQNRTLPPLHLLSVLDQEIAAKTSRLVGACTLRNSLLPIFKLPTELLSRIIFESVVGEANWRGVEEIYTMNWLRLMKVCRRFREAVSSGRILWTYIASPIHEWSPRTSTERIKVQLEKSMPLPLFVRLALRRDPQYLRIFLDPNSSCFLLNPARLRNLYMEGFTANINMWLSGLAGLPHPILKSLFIKAEFAKSPPVSLPLKLPDSVFSGGFPELRSLNLENVTVNLETLHGLTELSMRFDQDRSDVHGSQYTFSALVSSLAKSPDLTKLNLQLPFDGSSGFEQAGRVELPNLRNLDLDGSVEQCSHFLRAIKMPSSASLHLTNRTLSDGKSARRLMVQLRLHVRGTIQGLLGRTVRYLGVEASDDDMFLNADVEPPVMGKFSRYPYPEPEHYLRLSCYPEREVHRRQILSRLIDALPTSSLTHLDMRKCDSGTITATTWRMLILRLPHLKHVSLRAGKDSFHSFVSTLSDLLEENNPVPSLQHIYIDGNCSKYSTGIDSDDEAGAEVEQMKANGRIGLARLKEYMLRREPRLPVLELCDSYEITKGEVSLKYLEKCVSEKLLNMGYVYNHEKMKQARIEHRRMQREMAQTYGWDEDPNDRSSANNSDSE